MKLEYGKVRRVQGLFGERGRVCVLRMLRVRGRIEKNGERDEEKWVEWEAQKEKVGGREKKFLWLKS